MWENRTEYIFSQMRHPFMFRQCLGHTHPILCNQIYLLLFICKGMGSKVPTLTMFLFMAQATKIVVTFNSSDLIVERYSIILCYPVAKAVSNK